MSDIVVMATEAIIAKLRAELEHATALAAEEVAARTRVEATYAAFRRAVVTTAVVEAEEHDWCEEVYEILDGLGLTEADGVPPVEREVSVRVALDVRLDVMLARGQSPDTELVEEALVDWIQGNFGGRHWSE